MTIGDYIRTLDNQDLSCLIYKIIKKQLGFLYKADVMSEDAQELLFNWLQSEYKKN